ncbi:HNH endonuclease [Rhodococcus pyridinivorans]|uniref:HNH endonuclease n=1 Tax=Rhodococcus pyridinivorans TaxID=103816 RepID=UPI003D7F46D7
MREYRRRYAEKHGRALERQFAEARTDGRHRRRALLKGAHVESVRISDLVDRDGWSCGICGDLIDDSLEWPHLMSKTVDHIVPIARGGAHSLANCQLAHLTCNSRKQHVVIEEVDHAGSSSESAGSPS